MGGGIGVGTGERMEKPIVVGVAWERLQRAGAFGSNI